MINGGTKGVNTGTLYRSIHVSCIIYVRGHLLLCLSMIKQVPSKKTEETLGINWQADRSDILHTIYFQTLQNCNSLHHC